VSLGDGSDVDFGDLLDYLAGDPGTDAILLYAESVRQARKFMSAARSAARAKPTIIVKAGRVAESAHAAFSHTGALAGGVVALDARMRLAPAPPGQDGQAGHPAIPRGAGAARGQPARPAPGTPDPVRGRAGPDQ
jgi:acyl-CoA synthetase (NDP forming)